MHTLIFAFTKTVYIDIGNSSGAEGIIRVPVCFISGNGIFAANRHYFPIRLNSQTTTIKRGDYCTITGKTKGLFVLDVPEHTCCGL
jgi:hypothetical protein